MLHLLLDFDGTICDSREGVLKSVDYALDKLGERLSLTQKELEVMFLGPPLVESFGKIFAGDSEKIGLAIKYYRERYNVHGVEENCIFDGIPECLRTLKESGIKLHIASSKPENFIKTILTKYNIIDLFDAIYAPTLKEIKLTKYDIVIKAMEYAGKIDASPMIYMVGDRKFDVQGAHEANIPCIGVRWGYADVNELEEYKAEYIVNTCDELVSLAEKLMQIKEI